jgi:hypothetical protein
MQLENSESFRLNTERTLSKIREDFELIVSEFDEIKRLDSQRLLQGKKYEKENEEVKSKIIGNNYNYYQMMSLTSRSKPNVNYPKNSTNFTGSNNEGIINSNLNKKGPVFNINLNSLTINNNVNNSTVNNNQGKSKTQLFGNQNNFSNTTNVVNKSNNEFNLKDNIELSNTKNDVYKK